MGDPKQSDLIERVQAERLGDCACALCLVLEDAATALQALEQQLNEAREQRDEHWEQFLAEAHERESAQIALAAAERREEGLRAGIQRIVTAHDEYGDEPDIDDLRALASPDPQEDPDA